MKKMRLLGCMWIAMMGTGELTAAAPVESEWSGNRVISLLTLDEGIMQDFLQGKMRGYAVECPVGACLPLRVAVKGGVLSLDSAVEPLFLKVLKTCYVRYEEEGAFLFSTDLQKWKDFSEFFIGEMNASVTFPNGSPVAGLELELNQR